MTTESCWLVLTLVGFVWLIGVWRRHQHLPSRTAVADRGRRLLKPRTPDDCPVCRQQAACHTHGSPAHPPVRPWHEVKSHRGAPKRIATQGFACPNRTCAYYQITNAQVHALVGDGTHAKAERRETFRCQACSTTFSARRDTPLYRLKTASQRVGEVLTALAEGLDVAAAMRVFGHQHATITTWLTRAGAHSVTLHQRVFQQLHLPHVQLDEIRTRLRSRAQIVWLWVAIDPLSKLIPVLHLGPRTQDAAHATVHALCQTLAAGCMPVFTSDGLNLYFYALTAHFGQWIAGVGRRARKWQVEAGLLYGQVKKREKAAKAGAGDPGDAVRDARAVEDRAAGTGLERATEHRVCRAPQEGRCGKVWQPSFAARGRRCRMRHSCSSTSNGGGPTITSYVHTSRYSSRWHSQSRAEASASPSASANGQRRWRPA
jgi:transposase-like protein